MIEHYTGKRAAEIVGITYRQLDHWARTDLVRPSVADAAGSGTRRRYSYGDLLELKVIKTMLDAGIKLESVRDAFSYLREHLGEEIASAQLVIGGGTAILVRDDSELLDVLKKGQFVMTSVLSLQGVSQELSAAVTHITANDRAAAAKAAARPIVDEGGTGPLADGTGPSPRAAEG